MGPTRALRKRAEVRARREEAVLPASGWAVAPEEMRKVFHELTVHKIELELQNEELRRTQLDLDTERARYLDLYDFAPQGHLTLNERGLILHANLTATTLLGVSRSDLFKLPLAGFIHKDDQDTYYRLRKQLLATGEPHSCQVRIVRNEGKAFWAQLSANTAHDDKGGIELRLALIDITQTKQAEEGLESTLKLFEFVGQMARIGGWELNLATMEVYWSLETFRIHEVDPPNTPPLEQAIRFYGPEAQPILKAALDAGMAFGTPWDLELPMITAKGRSIWVRALGATVTEHGKPVKLVGAFQDITARKVAEVALEQSRHRFQDIAQVSGDWIWEVDAEGLYTFANGNVHDLLGYSAEEMLGQTPFAFMPPEEARRVKAIFAELVSRKASFQNLANTLVHRDGTLRNVLTTGVPILDADGGLAGYRGLDRDVTDHNLAETYRGMSREILQILNEPDDLRTSIQQVLGTLKACTGFDAVGIRLLEGNDYPYIAQEGFSEAFLASENSVTERGPDGGLCRDACGQVILECTCGLVISGKTDPTNPLFTLGGSAWTGDSFPLLEVPPGEDPRRHPRNVCIQHGYASVALVPIWNKERIVGLIQLNDRRKGCFTLEVIELLEGIALHLGAALLRKQAEEVLRESEERYRVMVDFAPEAILVYDVETKRLVDVNPNAERLLAATRSSLLGRDLTEFFAAEPTDPHAPTEELTAHLNRALLGQEATFERVIQTTQGELRTCEVHLVRLPSKDRKLIRSSFIDITDRRQQELLVGEMKSLAAKGNVAAYIAHEINNPLAGIRNSFRLVAQAIPKDHPHYSFTGTITRELDRIGNIIRTIYSLYRPNPAPTRVVTLDETLNEVLQLLSTLAKSRQITLELRPSAPPIRGLIPEDLLRQALFNLIQNAIDATPPGGCVRCGGRIVGEFLIVEVEDTGTGVSPEVAQHLFVPGFTTKKAVELSGLGLGLDTCRKLMDAVGGSIAFRNLEPGPGAVFSLHFPWTDRVRL